MKIPQTPPIHAAKNAENDPRVTPEMRQAANGLEAAFTQMMLKAMRGTVEKSEFSLDNSASEIYRGMLDEEYSDIAAKQNSLGLSQQIIDYWLRSMPETNYNHNKDLNAGPVRTGGTHEGQSSE